MREFVEHDVVREAARLHAHEAADDEDEGHVQPDDAVTERTTIQLYTSRFKGRCWSKNCFAHF